MSAENRNVYQKQDLCSWQTPWHACVYYYDPQGNIPYWWTVCQSVQCLSGNRVYSKWFTEAITRNNSQVKTHTQINAYRYSYPEIITRNCFVHFTKAHKHSLRELGLGPWYPYPKYIFSSEIEGKQAILIPGASRNKASPAIGTLAPSGTSLWKWTMRMVRLLDNLRHREHS